MGNADVEIRGTSRALVSDPAPQVKDFDASQWFDAKKSARSNDRVTHFAVAATKMAIEDAGIDVEALGDRCGVMVRGYLDG